MARSAAVIRITRVIDADNLGEQLEVPMRNLTAQVAKRMHRLVPKRSFRLDETIIDEGVERNGSRVTGTVAFGGRVVRGRLVNYGLFVERGTSRMMAQPFARPALLQSTSADLKSARS